MASAVTMTGPEYRQAVITELQGITDLTDLQAKDLEIGVFNWSIEYADKHRVLRSWKDRRFLSIYKNKARSVLANVNGASYIQNNRLLNRLKDGEFKPHDIAYMKHENMFPEKWNNLIDMKMKKEENMLNTRSAVVTDHFKCGKCKKNECSYYEMQTRSADEPTTIFVNCLNCGNRGRIG